MASGGSKDSGFLSVRAPGTWLRAYEPRDSAGAYSTITANFQALKQLNKNLNRQVIVLKEEIEKYKAQKKAMADIHSRNIKRQKYETDMKMKAKDFEIEKTKALHLMETEELKAKIEDLERTEIELKDMIKSLEATKYKSEYEKEIRETEDLKAEITKLKEQIAVLETPAEEKDDKLDNLREIHSMTAVVDAMTKMTEKFEGFEKKIDSMQSDILAIKQSVNDTKEIQQEGNEITESFNEIKESSEEMICNIRGLVLTEYVEHQSIEQNSILQPNCALPPLKTPRPSCQANLKPSYWKP